MRKIDELTSGCMVRSSDREMVFTLCSRDLAAPDTIRFWIQQRIKLGLSKVGDSKLLDAEECAKIMEEERHLYKK